MAAEISALWPEIQACYAETTHDAATWHQTNLRTLNVLKYRLSRFFVVAEACYRANLPGELNEAKLVNQVIEVARRTMPGPESDCWGTWRYYYII